MFTKKCLLVSVQRFINDQDYNTVYFDKELAQKNEAPIPNLLAREFDQEKPLEAIVTEFDLRLCWKSLGLCLFDH